MYDRLAETYLTHRNVKDDNRLLRRSTYRLIHNDEFAEADYPRMAELYELLYLQKHSKFNPACTADYMRLCHMGGIMRFLGLRDPSGRLDAMAGILIVDGTAPQPSVVRYDTTLDHRLGLYRMIIALTFHAAIAEGWNVNLSGGAASFKKNRGGQPITEYIALYGRHLSLTRRAVINSLTATANGVVAPLMKRFEV